MRYLYGAADEKYVKLPPRKPKENPLASFKFRLNSVIQCATAGEQFKKTDVPLIIKISPDTLLNLCLGVLDTIPLPEVYNWNIDDICKWLIEIGYRQYVNTFRENLISGKNLLLLDASALSAMNIKDFNHIKDIAQGIRNLYYFEMKKFGCCRRIYYEYFRDVYKLFRLQTGAKYNIRRSDLWRKLNLIRQNEPHYLHWELLERWLAFDNSSQPKELIGLMPTPKPYHDNVKPLKAEVADRRYQPCRCLPPCECYFTDLDHRRPWVLQCLPHKKPDTEFVETCRGCIPPCTCRWTSNKYQTRTVLTCLQKALPYKYGGQDGQIRYHKYEKMSRVSTFPRFLR